jgi:diguanylate cyclase (GGDEF)-like protein
VHRHRGSLPRSTWWWTVATVGCLAVVFGLCPWVAADRTTDVVLMFVLYPAVAGAVGAVACAGRRDLFLIFVVPVCLLTSVGLLLHDDDRTTALAVVAALYAFALMVLHHTVSESLLSAVRLRMVSEDLVAQLAREREELTDVCTQLSTSNEQLTLLASHDPLTGLFNRRGTFDRLEEVLAATTGPVGVLYCDLDRFKAVNDLLGHRGGDQFLTVLADRISRSLDQRCVAGRIGGDEFVVLLPDHDASMSLAVANRIVAVLSQPVHAEGREVPSSASIGVAVQPDHGTSSSDLLRHANAALHRAKRSGRNRVEVYDVDLGAEMAAAINAEQSMRRALDDGEILPFFQPEIDASTGHVVGAELLARWLRPDGSVVNAAEFLPLARRAGLLEKLTEKMLGQARPHIRRLASLGLPDGFRFRINLAPASTDRTWRGSPIDELVRGIDPNLLTVDVREAAVASDLPTAAATLASFRARGGRVCLDDFARGVSSLSLLRKLPIDEVRIDRQSIDTITSHPHDRAIVRSIIAVVREIGLAVTAEGVETGAQADALIALGCVRQQGHLYARALPAAEFETFLVERLAEGYVSLDAIPSSWDPADLDPDN